MPPLSPLVNQYTYTHDDAMRLTEAKLVQSGGHHLMPEPAYWRSYGFSPTDDWNLATVTDQMTGAVTSFGYDSFGQDQLLSMTVTPLSGPASTTVYQYDPRTGALEAEGVDGAGGNSPGNVQSPTRSYVWSNDDRLWQVVDTRAGVASRFAYDPSGRLIMEYTTDWSDERMRLWDGWGREGHLDYRATEREQFLVPEGWGTAGQKSSGGSFESLTRSPSGHVTDMLADSPIFAPYGELVQGSLHGELGFHSHEWHQEAGLYQMRQRWYSPASRRLLSRDRVIQHAGASYSLAQLSPAILLDPLGLEAVLSPSSLQRFPPVGSLVRALRLIETYNTSDTGRWVEELARESGAPEDFYVDYHAGPIPGADGALGNCPLDDCGEGEGGIAACVQISEALHLVGLSEDWPEDDPRPFPRGMDLLGALVDTTFHERGHTTGGPGHDQKPDDQDGHPNNPDPDFFSRQWRAEYGGR